MRPMQMKDAIDELRKALSQREVVVRQEAKVKGWAVIMGKQQPLGVTSEQA